jgi:hypothetical protein
MIVRVDGGLGTDLATENLDSAVGKNLVNVHVGLSSRSSLPYNKREVLLQLTLDDLHVIHFRCE